MNNMQTRKLTGQYCESSANSTNAVEEAQKELADRVALYSGDYTGYSKMGMWAEEPAIFDLVACCGLRCFVLFCLFLLSRPP